MHALTPAAFLFIGLAEASLLLKVPPKPTHLIQNQNVSAERSSSSAGFNSVRTLLYAYTLSCFSLIVYVVSVNPHLSEAVLVGLLLSVFLKVVLGSWELLAVTTALRTGGLNDLAGALKNFRFLKKVHNTCVFLMLFFLLLVAFSLV